MEELLTTKLYIPPTRPELVPRPRLIERLNAGLGQNQGFGRKLTLISAPAGFGKTTLVAEWVAGFRLNVESSTNKEQRSTFNFQPVFAWLSLDEADNDPARFLSYFVAALNRIEGIDLTLEKTLGMIQSPQPRPTETILVSLINEIAAISAKIIFVLDDYHLIDAQPIHGSISFLLENMPPQMHLVIATREDPQLPVARLRARGQLNELRAADLRFTSAEAAEFLNQVMGLNLSTEDIAALETRTEGWIAGLQLAAISLQGHTDTSRLIRSFTGSHRLVLDYLIEEVLNQQPQNVRIFLLQTAILNRLTGSLCDAVRFGTSETPAGQENGQAVLEMLDRANLFVVPLDDERHWYRYHHLFADLLRQRLHQNPAPLSTPSLGETEGEIMAELHKRASAWYEDNGMEIEAFHHAVAAQDVEHATRLIEGGGMPLTFRGALAPVLNWLESLPTTVLDAKPLLWVTYASAVLGTGQTAGVEEKLQSAEAALYSANQGGNLDTEPRDLLGRIAATRATLAWGQNQAETIIAQSRCALEHLHPDNLPWRTSTTWKMGYAYQLQGDRASAKQAYTEAIAICEASGNIFINIMASTGLGEIQVSENQLYLAAETYRRILQLVGDQPLLAACGAYLGLAHIFYEWNDLDAAEQHGQQSVQLARGIDSNDAFASCALMLARLKLAQGDVASAAASIAEAEQFVRQHSFVHKMPEIAAAKVLTLLRQGNLSSAADIAAEQELPISQARVRLAQGDTGEALVSLEPLRQQVEAKDLEDERLKVMVLQAVAHHAHGEKEEAVQLLGEALALAEPGGFVRTFVDEGPPMARLLYEALGRGISPAYVSRLLAAFSTTEPDQTVPSQTQAAQSELVEPLSEREIEVLQLIAEGLTNPEIAARLYLSLNTVKVHTRNIYGKLGVNKRTQAVARARALGILPSI